MSQNLSTTYVTGFDRNIRRTVEVKGGKLRDKVQLATGDLYREEGVYQRMTGGGLPNKRTNRFGDSPVSEADYSRRRVRRSDYEDGQFMDWSDIVRMATDPKSEKLDIMTQKFRRGEDIIVEQAALGVAQGGDEGSTDTAFATANIIDVALGAETGYTTAGFTYEKLTDLMTKYGDNNVDLEYTMPCNIITYHQFYTDMMNQDKFINLDYISRSVVDRSKPTYIPEYMGCQWLLTNIVPFMDTDGTGFQIDDTDLNYTSGNWKDVDDTDINACISMVNDAVLLEINPDITTEIDKRSDKGFNWYAYVKQGLGAVRMEEEKVYAIPCDRSPA
jgi:hypothetical protein